jgi:hypothetical protein
MTNNKRPASELLSPESQDKSAKRQVINSPPGFAAMINLNKAQLLQSLSDTKLKEELGDISPEGLNIALTINKRMKDVLCKLVGSLEYMNDIQSTLMEEKSTLQKHIEGMETQLRELNRDSIKHRENSESLENYSRRSNLLIKGIPEGWNQNIEEVVRSFMADFFGLPYSFSIERTHRIGNFFRRRDGSIRSRPIVVKFSFFSDREKVWNQRRNLGGTRFSLDEDFAPDTRAIRRKLLPVLLEAKRRRLGRSIELVKDTLKIDSKIYTLDTLHNLPKEVRDGSRWTDNQVTFFGELCPASNFHPVNFKHNEMVVENSEKMLFYKKAKLFNDDFTARRIKKESDPRVIKNLSKNIQGVVEEDWNRQIKRLVTPILMDKFKQNKHSLDWLRSTGSRKLVEAAGPHDKVWGNGLFLSDDGNNIPSKWTGENLQGQMLMEVREKLCPECIFPDRVQQLLNMGHDDDDDDDMDDNDEEASVTDEITASQGFEVNSPQQTEPPTHLRDRSSSFSVQFDVPITSGTRSTST